MDEQTLIIVAVAVLIVYDIGLLFFFKYRLSILDKLKSTDASTAKATVIKCASVKSKNTHQWRITYQFRSWDGKEWQNARSVSHSLLPELAEGDTIEVTYLTQAPQTNYPVLGLDGQRKLFKTLIKLIPLAMVGVLGALGVYFAVTA